MGQERESVELALIPDTVRNTTSGRYYTSFVGNASGTQQYSSNSFPFEMVNKDLWAKNEPNVGGPQCVVAFPQPEKNDNRVGLCDVPCTTNQWSGNSVVCEVARMNNAVVTRSNADGKRDNSNMMQNADGKRDQKNMMQNAGGKRDQKNMMQNADGKRDQRNMVQNGEERADNANMERRTVDCEEPWKAISGFPDKCYLYLYSTSTMEYETSNALCTERHQWSRLFTPMSMQERDSVELALIPDTVRNRTSGRFYTSFVKFASEDGNATQFASNSFPFEGLNIPLWASGEPNVSQNCVLAKRKENPDYREGLCNVPCTANGWSGNSVVCEVARMN